MNKKLVLGLFLLVSVATVNSYAGFFDFFRSKPAKVEVHNNLVPYSQEAFEASQKEGKTALLDFSAPWCGTCQRQGKVLNALVTEPDMATVAVFKVDFDTAKDLREKYDVNHQSTFVLIRNNEEVRRATGIVSEKGIKDFILKG